MYDHILAHIKAHPGVSNQEMSTHFNICYGNIKNYTGKLSKLKKIEFKPKQNFKLWYATEDYIKFFGPKPEPTKFEKTLAPASVFDVIVATPNISLADLQQYTNISSYRLEKMISTLVTDGLITKVKKSRDLHAYYKAVPGAVYADTGPKIIFDPCVMAKFLYGAMDFNRKKYPELKFNRPQYMY